MLNRIQRRSLAYIDIAPDTLTRSHWLLKLAVSDKAHPKIIERLEKLYEARLFLEFRREKEVDEFEFPNF
jgi:hypothetical protein